jgi:biopolymer transport protein ExbD
VRAPRRLRTAKPLFSWRERACVTAAALFICVTLLGSLLRAFELLYIVQFGADYRMSESPGLVYRAIFSFLESDAVIFPICSIFAILFHHFTLRRPQAAAAILVGMAVFGSLIACVYFADAFGAIQHLYLWDHDGSLGSLTASLGLCIYMGVLPLIALSLAEELDRAAISRNTDRLVEQAEARTPADYRRAQRHRRLIAIASGGALRPWMALRRILPVALLPAVFAFICGTIMPALSIVEYHLPLPALAAYAEPARRENPRVRISLDVSSNFVFRTTVLSLQGDGGNAAVQTLKDLRAQTTDSTFIELEIEPDVAFHQIVDLLSALNEAGFWKIVFVDDGA